MDIMLMPSLFSTTETAQILRVFNDKEGTHVDVYIPTLKMTFFIDTDKFFKNVGPYILLENLGYTCLINYSSIRVIKEHPYRVLESPIIITINKDML